MNLRVFEGKGANNAVGVRSPNAILRFGDGVLKPFGWLFAWRTTEMRQSGQAALLPQGEEVDGLVLLEACVQ